MGEIIEGDLADTCAEKFRVLGTTTIMPEIKPGPLGWHTINLLFTIHFHLNHFIYRSIYLELR